MHPRQLPFEHRRIRLHQPFYTASAFRAGDRPDPRTLADQGVIADLALDQQQIALGALTALLDGDAPLRAFHEQAAWYTQLTEALPPLLHPSSGSLSDPEILLDFLWLGSALVTHPAYVNAPEDAWLWSRLLEQSAAGLDLEPEPEPQPLERSDR